MKKNGAQLFCEALMRENVSVIFGIPGGMVLPLYDYLNRPEYAQHFKHILPKHEQGGGFAADGYARSTGKVGVAIGTSGPGATNLLTAIANSMMDSVPVVYITGQVNDALVGTDAFQEADVLGMTLPVVKHSYYVNHTEDITRIMQEAFYIASSGRPGPVHIDFAKNVWLQEVAEPSVATAVYLPGYSERAQAQASDADILKLETVLTQPGARPIIIAGHGVELARAESQLLQFAERHNLPVVNTILGMGTFPQNHPQWYGMIGMHGEAATNYAVDQANVVIGIGSRFDDRITGSLPEFIANKTFVHFEVDGSEIGKIVPTAVPLVGDLDHTLKRANTLLTAHQFASWWETLTELKRQYSFLQLPKYNGTQLSQPHVVNMISNITVGKAIVASDVGRHQMWVSRFYRFAQSHSHLSAGGLGSMGYGIPAAMGAALGNPGREVWAIVGDGGFMMNVQELATLAEHNIPVKIVVMADGVLGMVHQWQALLFNQNYSSIHLHNPDFYKLAEAFNIPAWSVTKMSELEKVINNARTVVGPTLIVCKVDPHQNIFPMVPPNTALRDQALNAEKIYVK